MSLHTFTQHPRSRLGLQTPHHVLSCETEEATSLPGLGLGPADLSSVTRMLPAALCGHVGCILSRGTPQRKPVGAGVQPRLSRPSYLPYRCVDCYKKGAHFSHFLLLTGEGEISAPGLHVSQTPDRQDQWPFNSSWSHSREAITQCEL